MRVDALLEQHVVQADIELSKLIDTSDARKDLADLLREILHDVIAMRHEINAYLGDIATDKSKIGKDIHKCISPKGKVIVIQSCCAYYAPRKLLILV